MPHNVHTNDDWNPGHASPTARSLNIPIAESRLTTGPNRLCLIPCSPNCAGESPLADSQAASPILARYTKPHQTNQQARQQFWTQGHTKLPQQAEQPSDNQMTQYLRR